MKIINSARELLPPGQKVCLGIGFFDGVHLGHQQIIRQTIADARRYGALAVIVTFDQHPNAIVAPTRVPPLIYPLHRKLQVIGQLGPEALLLLHFDLPFSQQSGEDFIRQLSRDLGQVQSICIGANFVFGQGRRGNVALLQALGQELHFVVHGLSAVSLDSQPVSSTRIRGAIKAGRIDRAGQMLGRSYSLLGLIQRGDGIGRQLGFPTANLKVDGLVLPPHGVYAVQVHVEGSRQRGVLNIGMRPTLQQPQPALQVEVHLLDFEGDLYGKELELYFVDRLRDERRFSSIPELREQIAKDILEALRRF